MKFKSKLIWGLCLLALPFGICLYENNTDNFKIVNKTNETLNLNLIGESGNIIENISINQLNKKSIKLPKDENYVDIIYHYDNDQSSESVQILNRDINENYSTMTIESVDNNGRIIAEFK